MTNRKRGSHCNERVTTAGVISSVCRCCRGAGVCGVLTWTHVGTLYTTHSIAAAARCP